jgi:hypothetical protein
MAVVSKREIFIELILPKFQHKNAVKFDTVEEMLGRVDAKNKTIGIINAPEFAQVLCEQSNNSNYILIDNDPVKEMYAKAKGIGYVTTEEYTNMKFDLIIQNPPFREDGKGSRCLYADFFKKSLDCADEVLSIMPTPDEDQSSGIHASVHKEVYTHNKWIGRNISDDFVFGTNHHIIKYGLYSKKVNNPYKRKSKIYDIDALPERPRMPRPRVGFSQSSSSGPYKSIRVNRKDGKDFITWLSHDKKDRQYPGEYLVIAHSQYQHRSGRMNALVVKNEPFLGAESHMLVWSFNTKKEAETFKDWLHSDTIKNELMRQHKLGWGTSLSLGKLAVLPDVG